MANKSLFASLKGRVAGKTDAINKSGGQAYKYENQHKLSQLAVTGTIGDLHYQDAQVELETVLKTAEHVTDEFLAKTAIYARQQGKMKDLPALLLAVLASRDPVLLSRAFPQVITNGKMLRNFVQIMRSGQTGRKSLGTRPKALVRGWLNGVSDYQLLQASIGNDPSLADVIKMVHPKPDNAEREAFYAWLIGKPCDASKLPTQVKEYLAFKEKPAENSLPDVPFQMLTHLPLSKQDWTEIALRGSWNMVRMNLNTFLRKGVFEDKKAVKEIANILRDPKRVKKANAFPYQLLTSYQALSHEMPRQIRKALHNAMEIAVSNVPAFDGNVVVCPDISGSMSWPVTGARGGATTATRYVDVAALVAAAVLRHNKKTTVLPFDFNVQSIPLEPRDTIMTNARRLSNQWGGGTNCSAPLRWLNQRREKPDLVILVSDNESWADQYRGSATGMMKEWQELKHRNPKAKLVCIDIAPYGTTQMQSRPDVLNVGGFSDAVFKQIAAFVDGKLDADQWVREIKRIKLN
ncbi:vWA domain-containing protein [Pseudovibrio ascidiaceicola]|uniref:vWA domain-containing protein n=1 Tax=Pseudovibrio ascidiaceicola TaxID=285279 RepID=UPI003D362495